MSELRKILIVDDSRLIHQMYRLVLMRYKNCVLLDAMNGLEALDILSKEADVDLILLDLNMPVMDGVEFMEKIKENSSYRDIPIIVLSTDESGEGAKKAQEAGALAFIKKSKADGLAELIKEAVSKSPSPFIRSAIKP